MSGIRLLVGTKKGAFVLTSDAKRKDWKVDGPHFAGWEIYHMKGSPVDPDRIYAWQTSAWCGPYVSALEPDRSTKSETHFHRDLGRGRVPNRRRRQNLETDQPRFAFAVHSRSARGSRPLRPSDRYASIQTEHALHAKTLGRDAER